MGEVSRAKARQYSSRKLAWVGTRFKCQGKAITTIESLTASEMMNPVSRAFVDNDAQQCGFCTPGFIMSSKALLDRHPNPTPEQVLHGLAGNFCRCGTYHGMHAAMAQMGRHAAPAKAGAATTPRKGA